MKGNLRPFLYPLLAGLIFSCTISGQSHLEDYLKQVSELKSFSGSIVISEKNKVQLHRGYGMADYEHGIPNNENSVHRIASLTKPLTAMAILKLFNDADSLSINDPISKFLPRSPENWHEVTVFELLTHTSGIPDHFGDLDAVPVEETAKEIEKVFLQEKESQLRSAPGENYRYSNFGYVLLGNIIEVITGKSYPDYMRTSIFHPLGMANSAYDDHREIISGRSEGYRLSGSQLMNDALKDPAAYSAGGLLSTTQDLLKWSKSLNTDIILPADQREKMFKPFRGDYGMGWQIIQKNGKTMYNHNGSTHGYNSRIVFYPDEELFIAVLGNNANIRAAAITCDLEALIFKDPDHNLSFPYPLPQNQLTKFTGEYAFGDESRTIRLEDEDLIFINGISTYELMPLSKKEFCYRKYEDIRINFLDENTFEISSCGVNPKIFRRSH